MSSRKVLFLILLTVGAFCLHGYHPWAEDAAIYLPVVEKLLNPHLFAFNPQFFESHASLTLYPQLIANSVRFSHLPLAYALLLWQGISIFLLLYACWELAERCYPREISCYAGVALVAALLTLPVAGTALYIMDQYLNPRNLTAFVGVLAVVKLLDRKYVATVALLMFAMVIHPLMGAFAVCFCGLLFWIERSQIPQAAVAGVLPLGLLDRPTPAYHPIALAHAYFYPLRWEWYEWLGVIGPLLLLWWFVRIARSRQMRNLEVISRALIIYQIIFVIGALVISIPQRFETLARLQPMRSLFLLYILFVLFAGGLIGEYFLKNRWWRWMALFGPLCVGMFYAQLALFPSSAHIEWPGSRQRNPWEQAFQWARNHTPADAVFALDPDYMHIPGEDENSFRALAERSMLADAVKDSGAASMFPPMAEEWLRQVQAQSGWRTFGMQDFRRLQGEYGVNWVVLQQPEGPELECPFQNRAVKVCKLPAESLEYASHQILSPHDSGGDLRRSAEVRSFHQLSR